jgi:uncharacterized protein YndB with AHSA1/START domain
MEGTYETVDGSPAVRFDRRLDHPVEDVWRAVTEPHRLSQWFPTTVEMDLRLGGAMWFSFPDGGMPDMTGEVTELDPPRLFAFLWGYELLRFELEGEDGGCRLRLTHLITNEDEAARNAAGWQVCLGSLERLLSTGSAQAPGTEATEGWLEIYDSYVEAGMPSGAAIPGA